MVEYAWQCPSQISVSYETAVKMDVQNSFPLMEQQIYLTTKLTVTLRIQITMHHHTPLYSTYSFWGRILWTTFQREFGYCSTALCHLHLHSYNKIWGIHSSENSCCCLCWWWPTFWTNILTIIMTKVSCRCWCIVSLLNREEKELLMVWKLQGLYNNQWMSL
jgi:hypothetical protein